MTINLCDLKDINFTDEKGLNENNSIESVSKHSLLSKHKTNIQYENNSTLPLTFSDTNIYNEIKQNTNSNTFSLALKNQNQLSNAYESNNYYNNFSQNITYSLFKDTYPASTSPLLNNSNKKLFEKIESNCLTTENSISNRIIQSYNNKMLFDNSYQDNLLTASDNNDNIPNKSLSSLYNNNNFNEEKNENIKFKESELIDKITITSKEKFFYQKILNEYINLREVVDNHIKKIKHFDSVVDSSNKKIILSDFPSTSNTIKKSISDNSINETVSIESTLPIFKPNSQSSISFLQKENLKNSNQFYNKIKKKKKNPFVCVRSSSPSESKFTIASVSNTNITAPYQIQLLRRSSLNELQDSLTNNNIDWQKRVEIFDV